MAKYRLIEERCKGQDPLWYVEKYGWTLFGKRWYRCTSYYQCLDFAAEAYSYINKQAKKFPYKKTLKSMEV